MLLVFPGALCNSEKKSHIQMPEEHIRNTKRGIYHFFNDTKKGKGPLIIYPMVHNANENAANKRDQSYKDCPLRTAKEMQLRDAETKAAPSAYHQTLSKLD